jgi:hydroxymethylbilane synthase
MRLKPIKIGARKSDLARLQAYLVGEALRQQGHEIEYVFRESLGDKNLNDPLWKMPEKGVFTQDFFQDLVKGELDLVVHSWKDLPTEENKQTFIAATLPRADQRDLLLFKKSSQGRRNLHIFSSSPRREKNLKPFLAEVIPGAEGVQFHSVRGNVQTRVRKLFSDPARDGLIVAKAALDRLLSAEAEEFSETREFLREALREQLLWMVLPLEINPNAPAQGALAVEICRGRQELHDILKGIHCEKTYAAVQREREIFSRFGGGCHQKIGVAILDRDYGQLEILCGEAPDGEEFHHRQLRATVDLPKNLKPKAVEFEAHREKLTTLPKITADAVWVARSEAWPENFSFTGIVWTAGIKTWKKLALQGVWVHGCAEGLGENEKPGVEELVGRSLSWLRLTHVEAAAFASEQSEILALGTYRLNLIPRPFSVTPNDIFIWRSYSQFAAALKLRPELKQAAHACGPGRSHELIKRALGPNARLSIAI